MAVVWPRRMLAVTVGIGMSDATKQPSEMLEMVLTYDWVLFFLPYGGEHTAVCNPPVVITMYAANRRPHTYASLTGTLHLGTPFSPRQQGQQGSAVEPLFP